ncbi:SPOR domain-containing protein [Sphingomonas sp. RB56-2]|uniref:SPOR domain-containing protein n=1 Tax=Sphingomonas brevis TaxID=2908206 RepID=A0ABT0S5C1_9SPHN|nr:SPOR domain-containing protein [Sphingomonas brevis]MCL6739577.1 SPOR domain-containing protein [Sphingomonas brevis]
MLKRALVNASVAALLIAGTCVTSSPAIAQAAAETAADALSRNIRVLAASPRDFNALIGAGKAALELGDVQAAAGFFGRAEEVNPNAAAAKVGLGAAMAHMGDADGAIFYFNQASRLGAQPMVMAADRGMAHDLQGDLKAAQADYRLAIASLGSDEARRRLALSLAIGRDRKGALDTIQPLLNRRDAAAQRTRAFVLALVGDQIAAAEAIEAVMPGGSARFAPFFRYLPNLSTTEKAAAVHLGIFPENPEERVALAQASNSTPELPAALRANQPTVSVRGPAADSGRPLSPPVTKPQQPVKLASADPPPVKAAPSPAFTLPSDRVATASPSFSLPSANGAAPTAINQAPVETKAKPAQPEPQLAAGEESAAESNLTGIDKLLATLAEAPPAPEPKVEPKKPAATASNDKAVKAAAAKKAAEKKAREEKLAAEKKAKEEAARLGVAGTHWVQLAGGSNQDRMAIEYRKLSAKAGKLLKSRAGYVTGGKDYFRLLVGPFDSKSESQAFVNKLEKEGVDGFSWTRTPAKIKIEKLSKT